MYRILRKGCDAVTQVLAGPVFPTASDELAALQQIPDKLHAALQDVEN